MIGYLIGKVVESFEEELILVTSSGVGYQVFFSNRAVLPLFSVLLILIIFG